MVCHLNGFAIISQEISLWFTLSAAGTFCVEIPENAASIGKCGINFKSGTCFLPEKRRHISTVVFNYEL